MAPNLPPSITVNKNLASTLRNYIRAQGGKNVSEADMAKILARVAQADAKRDSGEVQGGSIFDGGSKYFGGDGTNFRVKQGQQIQLSQAEWNMIFEGYLETKPMTPTEEVVTPQVDDSTPIVTNSEPVILEEPTVDQEVQDITSVLIQGSDTLEQDGLINTVEYAHTDNFGNQIKNKTQMKEAFAESSSEFLALDTDGDGYLQPDEIQDMVALAKEEYGEITDETVTAATLQKRKDLADELLGIIAKQRKGELLTEAEQYKLTTYQAISKQREEVALEKVIRNTFHIKDNEEIPSNITAKYVEIGGQKQIVFQRDGQTMDKAQLQKFAKEWKAGQIARDFSADYASDMSAEIKDSKALAKSQMAEINMYGDGKGKITFEEFLKYQADKAGNPELVNDENFKNEVKMTFDAFDKSGNGKISKKEMRQFTFDANNDGQYSIQDVALNSIRNTPEMSEEMKAKMTEAVNQGYLQNISADNTPIYVKDGKMYKMNKDGSVGDEIKNSADTTVTAPILKPQIETPVDTQTIKIGQFEFSEDGYKMDASKPIEGENELVNSFVAKSKKYYNKSNTLYTVRGHQSRTVSDAQQSAEISMRQLARTKDTYNQLKSQEPNTLNKGQRMFIADFEKKMQQMGLKLDDTGNFVNADDTWVRT